MSRKNWHQNWTREMCKCLLQYLLIWLDEVHLRIYKKRTTHQSPVVPATTETSPSALLIQLCEGVAETRTFWENSLVVCNLLHCLERRQEGGGQRVGQGVNRQRNSEGPESIFDSGGEAVESEHTCLSLSRGSSFLTLSSTRRIS